MFAHYKNQLIFLFLIWGFGGGVALLLFFISDDLSSSLVVLAIVFGLSFIYSELVWLHIMVIAVVMIGTILYVNHIANNLPLPQQLEGISFRVGRIAAWLAPERYDSDQSYQTLQALRGIGAGGWFGRGLGNSIQKISAIPEAHNDMIFSIICEEIGIFGGVLILYLFGYLLYYIAKIAMNTKELFGSALVIGVMLHIGSQMFINIAVNLNVIPNTGIGLPFISYGGTAVFCQLIEIAIVLSVEFRSRRWRVRKMIRER